MPWLLLIKIILMVLPILLKWLLDLLEKGQAITADRAADLGKAMWYCREIGLAGTRLGVQAVPPDKGEESSKVELT